MIRGISKQVIVVEGKNRDFFESAIFILREDCLKEEISEKDLLRQAKTALADLNCISKIKQKYLGILYALGGFSFSCLLWLIVDLL